MMYLHCILIHTLSYPVSLLFIIYVLYANTVDALHRNLYSYFSTGYVYDYLYDTLIK